MVKYVNIYAEEKKEDLLNIEGFFGFAPYILALRQMADNKFKNKAENESGGKVYQNNQYDHKYLKKK